MSGGTLVVNKNVTFNSLSLSSGTITTNGFSGNWTGSAWSPAPGPGNGRLQFSVTGLLDIGSSGLIHVDSLGFAGGTGEYRGMSATSGASNQCVVGSHGGGLGSLLYDSWEGYCFTVSPGAVWGAPGSGGSYGASGTGSYPGAVFGSTDFATQLYLGSGGGSATYNAGGRGAGAISITAGSLTNAGTIRANGGAAANWAGYPAGGGGSGGTIVLEASTFSNANGSIQARGASAVGNGGAGGKGRIRINCSGCTPDGTIDPAAE
jgi:hypothetical protein